MRLARLIHALRWRLRATARLWRPKATHAMPLLEPEPAADGRLDQPGPGARMGREMTTVSGWVTFPSGPCVRVEIRLGEHLLGLARLGIARGDLGRQIGPEAGLAGFELTTDLGRWPGADGEAELRAVAFDAAGARHEVAAPVTVCQADEEEDELDSEIPVAASKAGPGAVRTLIFTHQLTLGGAQLYLLDLLGQLVERGAVEAEVVSTLDGPLRERLAELGIPSHVTSFAAAEGPRAHAGRVEELTAWASGRGFEALFVNTATETAFPGIEVAEKLGIPSLWAIHESFPPPILWGNLDPRVREAAEAALGKAAAVIFEADATRRIFEPYAPQGRFHTIPYGLDLRPIDAARSDFDAAASRREAGIEADAELVVCIGTVEPRKAQVPLTQAFEAIARERPAARLALVGGRDDDDTRLLGEYIQVSPLRDRIDLIPITPEVDRWYGMADLLVCASDVESLPRTVLDAMAWETPVLATDVYGLPELIEDGENGWLCPPRDTVALADALRRALSTDPEERREIARRGRALVERRHDLPAYAERIAALLEEAVGRAGNPSRGSNVVGT